MSCNTISNSANHSLASSQVCSIIALVRSPSSSTNERFTAACLPVLGTLEPGLYVFFLLRPRAQVAFICWRFGQHLDAPWREKGLPDGNFSLTEMSVMSAAASHILGNQTGGPGAGVPASRRARSPQLTAEEFFAQNQAHLRQRNSELAQMAARRRPQCRADDAAAGPVPEYILAKRGTLGRGGHYHERTRGVKPLPRGALGGSAAVVDRTRSGPCTDRAEAADSFAGGSPVNGSPRGRLNERTRLMPYAPHYSAYGEHEDEEGQKIAVGQTQAQKQKKLLARGWRLVQGGSGPVQRWVSPFRPMKTVIGLDAAYDAAASMPPHAGGIGQGNTTATQIIQVKQVRAVVCCSAPLWASR